MIVIIKWPKKYCGDLRRRRIRAKAAQKKKEKSWLVKCHTLSRDIS